ncbi:RsmD family RNA methyltransferase [candidate division KSB1 bacterium]|nr:RsmD family RNA methyltransferase [candidate division KSB1 bacterium]
MAIRLSSGSRRHTHGGELRPTAARTLESVFNMLAGEAAGKSVLDLFCGVGSYGIHALKHGARLAVLVDRAHESEKRTLRSLAQFHLQDRAVFCREEVAHFLHNSARWPEPFELIFADPPYDLVAPGPVIESIMESGLFAAEGVLVFEHSKRQAPPEVTGLALRKSRVFGETTVSIWDRK